MANSDTATASNQRASGDKRTVKSKAAVPASARGHKGTAVTANGDGDAPLREVAPLAELVPVTKITANLPENLAQGLRDYARSSGTTFTQSLKEAISLKLYVERLVREGATIVVEQPGQRKRELVFHL